METTGQIGRAKTISVVRELPSLPDIKNPFTLWGNMALSHSAWAAVRHITFKKENASSIQCEKMGKYRNLYRISYKKGGWLYYIIYIYALLFNTVTNLYA